LSCLAAAHGAQFGFEGSRQPGRTSGPANVDASHTSAPAPPPPLLHVPCLRSSVTVRAGDLKAPAPGSTGAVKRDVHCDTMRASKRATKELEIQTKVKVGDCSSDLNSVIRSLKKKQEYSKTRRLKLPRTI